MYLLEVLLSWDRLVKVKPFIRRGARLCDVGCGGKARLLRHLASRLDEGIGIDSEIYPKKEGKLRFLRADFNRQKLPLSVRSVDVVTVLAVIEHVKFPERLVRECYRILKPGGVILITTPSRWNEPLLLLLAKTRFVSPEMIGQHETYFTLQSLGLLLEGVGFGKVKSTFFQFGLNIFARAVKPG